MQRKILSFNRQKRALASDLVQSKQSLIGLDGKLGVYRFLWLLETNCGGTASFSLEQLLPGIARHVQLILRGPHLCDSIYFNIQEAYALSYLIIKIS